MNTPSVAMMVCVCGGHRHIPSWQLAYWRPQSLHHITGYVQLVKFADSDHLTPIH